MNHLSSLLNQALGLGLDPAQLRFGHIALRGVVVFVVALVMVRVGDKRFFSKKSAFDVILGFILASMLARAVNGSVAFFPTLGAGFVLVGLHWSMAWLARRSHRFGNLVKGRCEQVIHDGRVDERMMRRFNLTNHDLLEDLRTNGNLEDPRKVKAAWFERNGQISVVK